MVYFVKQKLIKQNYLLTDQINIQPYVVWTALVYRVRQALVVKGLKWQQGYINRITAFVLISCLELEGVTSHTQLPKNSNIRSYTAQNVTQLSQIDYEYLQNRFSWVIFQTQNKSRCFFTDFTNLYDQKACWLCAKVAVNHSTTQMLV